MASRWSQSAYLVELPDEPTLADALSLLCDQVKTGTPVGDSEAPGRPASPVTPNIVLDFGNVSYMNSSHIAAVLRLRKLLLERRRRIALCSLSDEVYSVLMLTGLERVLHCAPDQKTALAQVHIESQQEG